MIPVQIRQHYLQGWFPEDLVSSTAGLPRAELAGKIPRPGPPAYVVATRQAHQLHQAYQDQPPVPLRWPHRADIDENLRIHRWWHTVPRATRSTNNGRMPARGGLRVWWKTKKRAAGIALTHSSRHSTGKPAICSDARRRFDVAAARRQSSPQPASHRRPTATAAR
ncbi:hypothetical protein MTO96_052322, partial [Rhipicephalus appendiculatus]